MDPPEELRLKQIKGIKKWFLSRTMTWEGKGRSITIHDKHSVLVICDT